MVHEGRVDSGHFVLLGGHHVGCQVGVAEAGALGNAGSDPGVVDKTLLFPKEV